MMKVEMREMFSAGRAYRTDDIGTFRDRAMAGSAMRVADDFLSAILCGP